MTPIADAVERVRAAPAPVLIVDTRNFLDLFRTDHGRRTDVEELKAAATVSQLLTVSESALHLIVPELIPREFGDNADSDVGQPFRTWLDKHNENHLWLMTAGKVVGIEFPPHNPLVPLDVQIHFRGFAEQLLATAIILARDADCVLRAVERVIVKKRPSHKNHLKDSMNLEQALEFGRRLHLQGPFPYPLCFISSNRNDFAEPSGTQIHPELKAEFDAAGLVYLPHLRDSRKYLPKIEPPTESTVSN